MYSKEKSFLIALLSIVFITFLSLNTNHDFNDANINLIGQAFSSEVSSSKYESSYYFDDFIVKDDTSYNFGDLCKLDNDLKSFLDENLDEVLEDIKDTTTKSLRYKKQTAIYTLAASTNSILDASLRCDDYESMEKIMEIYNLALGSLVSTDYYFVPGLPHSYYEVNARKKLSSSANMWLYDFDDKIIKPGKDFGKDIILPREHVGGSAKLIYEVSRILNEISEIPNFKRTESMNQFVEDWWDVVIEDHYNRWFFLDVGEFRAISGKKCQSVQERYNLFEYFEKIYSNSFNDNPSYCNTLRDYDFIYVSGIIEAMTANIKDPVSFPLEDELSDSFYDFISLSLKLIDSKIYESDIKSRDGLIVSGIEWDPGALIDMSDYCYGNDESISLPVVAPSNPCRDPNKAIEVGPDFNHFKSYYNLLESINNNQEYFSSSDYFYSFNSDNKLRSLSNQVSEIVFNGDFISPLFSNYLDGSNGWYRVSTIKDVRGYCPSCRSDSYYNGGWAKLSYYNEDLEGLNTRLIDMLKIAYVLDDSYFDEEEYDVVSELMREYYGVYYSDGTSTPIRKTKEKGIGAVPIDGEDEPKLSIVDAIVNFAQ